MTQNPGKGWPSNRPSCVQSSLLTSLWSCRRDIFRCGTAGARVDNVFSRNGSRFEAHEAILRLTRNDKHFFTGTMVLLVLIDALFLEKPCITHYLACARPCLCVCFGC